MKFNYKQHILDLEKKGITYIKNFYSPTECKKYIKKFESIINKKESQKFVSSGCQLITNPFIHDSSLAKLIYSTKLENDSYNIWKISF